MRLEPSSAAVLLGALVQTAPGDVTTSPSAPTDDILTSNDTGTTWSRIIDEGINPNHARGMTFRLGDGAMTHYEITAITIHKNGAQTFSNDTMTLRVYEGTSAQWDTGTGHSTADDGDDYYVGTTVTPLYIESFIVDGSGNPDGDGVDDGEEIVLGHDPSDATHLPGDKPNIIFIMIDDATIQCRPGYLVRQSSRSARHAVDQFAGTTPGFMAPSGGQPPATPP